MRHRSTQKRGTRPVITAVALALAAGGTVPVASARDRGVDGVWRVEGYGAVVSVADGRLREYQTTSVSCLKGGSAQETARGVYRSADGEVFTVLPHGSPRVAGSLHVTGSLHVAGSPGDRRLRRVAELPQACREPVTEKDPVAAFDVFWQSFEENYPFFAAKGIDWHAVRDEYRPEVHPDTSREELFALFAEIVKPLYDAHVAVLDGDRHFAQVRPGTEMPGEALDSKVKRHIVRRDLKGRKPQEFANGRISYADLPGGQGYLRISGFTAYDTEDPSYAAQLAQLDEALSRILTAERTASRKGLIIDLRVNGGGFDSLGLHLAERLTDTPYLAYRKRTRYTRPQSIRVRPARNVPRYTGPVAVLTGGSTVSAGETFTQALMDRPGTTVRVGGSTQGVFSDVLERKLPNGMAVWLPNEQFLTRTGRSFDGTGIPPHLRTPVFTEEEFAKNRDSAFDAAVAALRHQKLPSGVTSSPSPDSKRR